ncbi:MAG: hypothetical protein KBS86_01395 [Proteobacteria bacterium]|nr:hypothetical protein [Candidatus Enterousia scatequi]
MDDAKKAPFTFSEKWNVRFMELAKTISTWSKDESTKVGCVIVGPDKEIRSMGYNGFPRGVRDDIAQRNERPQKYQYTEHAERNAIYNITYFGGSVRNCSLYVTMPPCVDCARAIIQSGISEVIFLAPTEDAEKSKINGWRDTVKTSFEMFDEVGIRYKALNKPITPANICFTDALSLVTPEKLDTMSKQLIAKNGINYQISMCLEEMTELHTELLLNNSFDNIASETADMFITLNHVVCAYDIKKTVNNAINQKIQNQNFMTEQNDKLIAFLNLQKELLKNINRKQDNIPNIIVRTADAYVALAKLIVEQNNFDIVRQAVAEKIQRTIQRNLCKTI